jgi:hypothetical protein
MRPGSSFRLAIERAAATVPIGAVWRRCGLGRPFAAVLVLALIGGAVTMARSLLDLRDAGRGSGQDGWHTAVAGGLRAGEVGPAFALPRRGEAPPDGELEGLLAGLKDGAFGVAFEAAPVDRRAIDPTSPEAEGAFLPVVLIDAERPPLRIDIMGLTAVGRARGDAVPAP